MKPRSIIAGTALTLMIAGGFVLDPSYEPVGWSHSQTVPLFDTPSGELREGEFSVTDTGQTLLMLDGEMKSLDEVSEVDLKKLSEVRYLGVKAEDVYKDGSKSEVTIQEYEQVKVRERVPEKFELKLKGIERAEAAISITGTSSAHTSFANSVTFALNCTGATDPGVLVFLSNRTLTTITGVTYNGDALTEEVQSLNLAVAGHEVWSRAAADIGNFNVVISNAGFQLHTAYATCLSGTDQTDLVEATTSVATGFGSSITGSVTSLTNGAWIMTGINLQNNNALTPDASETELYDEDNPDGSLGRTGVSYFEKATAGSETMGWSFSGDNYAMILAAVKPSVLAAPTVYKSTIKGGVVISGGVIIK